MFWITNTLIWHWGGFISANECEYFLLLILSARQFSRYLQPFWMKSFDHRKWIQISFAKYYLPTNNLGSEASPDTEMAMPDFEYTYIASTWTVKVICTRHYPGSLFSLSNSIFFPGVIYLYIETEIKWLPFRRLNFQANFLAWKCINFDYNFTEVCS